MIFKDETGRRIMDPDLNKEIIAKHYEDLYSQGNAPPHPHHEYVTNKVSSLSQETTCNPLLDAVPTKEEIKTAIANKKNGKATTDWKNEILKRGGSPMVDLIYPVIKVFWKEHPPRQWNEGIISNVWKGKGDREQMSNQRGITVSSSVAAIAEEIITDRLLETINFTQSQAGASTADHIFILKSLISLAIKRGMELILTFYDIKKAYDRADMDDMLNVVNEQGFTGKIWRLTKSFNKDLTARVKTKAGFTRQIERDKGGKQGGKIMVPLDAKMMDTLSEDLSQNPNLGIKINDLSICCLEYVDDVTTMATGYKQQEMTLRALYEFALKRQLEWGAEKCKVMEIGSHKEKKSEWKLGDKTITKCHSYRYLGEEISRDGKNKSNLEERFKKIKGSVMAIITCGRSDIMKKIETKVLLKLHETVTIPAYLYNAETWNLNNGEKKEVDRMEIWALKHMLGLPTTTPTPAVIFATGTLYASVRVNVKQLIYLQQLLQKEDHHWAKMTLRLLDQYQIGWAKMIHEILTSWDLEKDWNIIEKKSETSK